MGIIRGSVQGETSLGSKNLGDDVTPKGDRGSETGLGNKSNPGLKENPPDGSGEGAGKKGFSALIKDMVFQNKIQVLVLLETRISGSKADRVVRSLGFDNFFIREAVGFSGGIWILWNKSMTSISILEEDHQFVHSKITWLNSGIEEYFTFIYGSPRRPKRRVLWEGLRNIAATVEGKWAAMGDFNAYMQEGEKQGGAIVNRESVQDFVTFLSECGLSDPGFSGPKFTWKRGAFQERLDRLVGNEEWFQGFPNRSIFHLHFHGSDHRPIVLRNESKKGDLRGIKPFRFLAAWVINDSFGEEVDNCWENETSWIRAKDKFQRDASAWHHNIFKIEKKRKFKLQRRIKGVDSQLSRGLDEALERLHKDLWFELNTIYIHEELSWFQRSRSNWLAFGDRNSKLFHAATVARTRKNKIGDLKKK
ncbi:uncharacterized protein LOC133318127 [Gastrolobium bilobum]|uniref:uncharacterized protein LOC133318127 n=1 Tax=Gastrolobium bilobum TaxID=150636 RepID=UPI002AB21AF1|nr:uncharacterized protein LOC133318127 [Gastrolobium bilobum]